ncbi:chitin deacetylase [Mortierella sp. NVP85]|nr:chitin deacetylase [Mortierella sp. NVP85]
MITYLSVMAAVLALATASPAVTTPSTPSPSSAPAPSTPSLIPLPPFSGTFANVYPARDQIPPTDTDLVKKWMSEINTTAIESFPVVPFTAGGDPQNPKAVPEAACDWTITNCINKDLTTCPLGVWGLTYDDGPTEFSGPLYDALDKTDQKATLFYIGSNVVQNWQLARRACAAGHHIAVHTWSHHPSTSLTNEQFVAEVKYTEMAIQELCGFTPKYFRPPYGDVDNRIRSLLWQMGYTNVIWDYDTDDWKLPPGGSMTAEAVDAEFTKWIAAAPTDTTGHITLEHELYKLTVDAAVRNLPKIQATWKVMPVSACINDAHPYKETNITLATMDGSATTGVTNTPNLNTTSSSAASPSGASPTIGGKQSDTKGSGAASVLTREMNVLGVVVAVVVTAFGAMV